MEQQQEQKKGLSSATLHILAMALMLCDHLWATLLPGQEWLTCVGRLAFPIFAFLTVEGYFYTKDRKRYFLRMLGFALLSEVPFDLMYGGRVFYPYHQNVIWTLLLGLVSVWFIEKVRQKKKPWATVLVGLLVAGLGFAVGTVTMLDYYGMGVLTVVAFYIFRGRKWWCLLGQILALYWINVELIGGQFYPVFWLGREWELSQQGLALLALIPIWLYRGRQGYHSKGFQYFCYAFYPAHLLILGLLVHLG